MKTMVTKFTSLFSKAALVMGTALAVFSMQLAPAFAQSVRNEFGLTNTAVRGVNNTDLQTQVINLVNTIFILLGFIAVMFIIYAGIKLIISRGNEAAMKEATKILQYSIMGFLLIILSYGIVRWIVSFFAGANNAAGTTDTRTGNFLPNS